jgi:two-component system, cell cycle response regulator DivK
MHTLESTPLASSPLTARTTTAPLPGRSATSRAIASSDLYPPLVLVIDDHDDSRTIARLVLESAGFRVVDARTGFEGLRIALDAKPLVVLLDLVLPGVDGWEIARLLRLDSTMRDSIIVAVTAVATPEDHDRALLAGCDEVLTKPVPPTSMLDTVRRYVGLPVPAAGRSC